MYTGLFLTGMCQYFYFRSRLTLCRWVFSASFQQLQQLRKWIFSNFLPYTSLKLDVHKMYWLYNKELKTNEDNIASVYSFAFCFEIYDPLEGVEWLLTRWVYRIYSINRPGRLLNFWTLRVGAYSRWALIRGWALIKFSAFSACVLCLFCDKTINGNNKTRRCNKSRFL